MIINPQVRAIQLIICPILKLKNKYPNCESGSLKNSIINLKNEYKIKKYPEIIPGIFLSLLNNKYKIINKTTPSNIAS